MSSTGARGILQHEGETLGRIGRIERQIGAAGLEDAEQPHHHLQRALDAQSHHHLGTDAETLQVMRQLIGAGIELRIGQRRILEHHRHRIGASGRLGGKQSGKVADGIGRAVSFHSRRMVWRSAADRMSRPPIGCSGVRNRGLQQPNEPLAQRLDAPSIEQIRTIVEPQLQALARYAPPGRRDNGGIMAGDVGETQAAASAAGPARSTG